MRIELLYILPILALSVLVFILLLRTQGQSAQYRRSSDLSRQVEEFNIGQFMEPLPSRDAPEVRLTEIEKTIRLVTQALSNQQRMIEGFGGQSSTHSSEITDLKERLRELQKEYDIVLSENYSLRARIKKLTQQVESQSASPPKFRVVDNQSAKNPFQQLYGDTRMMDHPALDDTREIDLSGLSAS